MKSPFKIGKQGAATCRPLTRLRVEFAGGHSPAGCRESGLVNVEHKVLLLGLREEYPGKRSIPLSTARRLAFHIVICLNGMRRWIGSHEPSPSLRAKFARIGGLPCRIDTLGNLKIGLAYLWCIDRKVDQKPLPPSGDKGFFLLKADQRAATFIEHM